MPSVDMTRFQLQLTEALAAEEEPDTDTLLVPPPLPLLFRLMDTTERVSLFLFRRPLFFLCHADAVRRTSKDEPLYLAWLSAQTCFRPSKKCILPTVPGFTIYFDWYARRLPAHLFGNFTCCTAVGLVSMARHHGIMANSTPVTHGQQDGETGESCARLSVLK